MTNNHTRNQRRAADNAARRTEREMENMENAWDAEPAWPVLVQADGEVLGAQGGVGNTADEGTAAPGEVTAPRKRKARTRKRGGAAEPATDADADNQGLPGSAMATDDVEAGQGLQETADAFWDDPRVIALQQKHREEFAALEHDAATREAGREAAALEQKKRMKKFEDDLYDSRSEVNKQTNAFTVSNRSNAENASALAQEKAAFQKYRDEHEETIKTAPATAHALAESRKLFSDVVSELQDAQDANGRVTAERDELIMEVENLQATNERLESEAATNKDLLAANAAANSGLEEKISQVHAEFEHAFSEMAKDLTMDEKFAYARDLQQNATRLAAESTLHHELEEDHTPEIFSFSGITSVETIPVAAVHAVVTKKPAVVALPAAAAAPVVATKKPFGFSTISSVNTPPVALPAAGPKTPMAFSGISSIETAPVAAPIAAAPAAAPTKKKPMTLSGITSVSTAPIAAVIEEPEPIVNIIEIHTPYDRFVDRFVDRAVVPWWMWLLFLLGMLVCLGNFAALWREQQIWVTANDTAYQRLMGVNQETWLEWIALGVKDLLLPI